MSKEKFKSDTLIFWLQRKKSLKLTNKDIASLSNVPLSTIEQIMCGKIKSPRLDTVEAIERALGINNGIRDEVEINDYFPIPLLGSVVAGVPIESQENTEGYVYISFRPKQEYFALRVHGESMINAGIKDKSVLIVHKQEMAENGDIIVNLQVAADDMGKVIGKQGRIAKAIRTVVKAAASRDERRVVVEIIQ